MTISLSQFITVSDVQAFINAAKADQKPEGDYNAADVDAWYRRGRDNRERAFVIPAMEFFKAKLEAGELRPCPNIQGRSTNFIHFWDSLVNGTGKDHEKKWALEEMETVFGSIIISPATKVFEILFVSDERSVSAQEVYDSLIKTFDEGNFPWFSVSQTQSCGETGEYLNVQFENWTPYIGSGRTGEFIPCEIIMPPTKPQTVEIEFKTGNLVAMDWFRDSANAFNDWTDAQGAADLPSINSRDGIIKSTEFYANLGIVHVFVGNSSPNVYAGEGLIAVGNNWCEYTADGRERYSDCDDDGNESEEAEAAYEHAQENPPAGMTDEGSVCTDLWWVTIIERERLVEILVEQLGEDRRAEAEAFANDQFDVNMQVEPGKYTLHFDGHPSSFYKLLDDKTKFRIGTPYFALTKDPA